MSGFIHKFEIKCREAQGDDDWMFILPLTNRLLPLKGTLTEQLMRHPDMFDRQGEPCPLVLMSGSASGTTIGRANGALSIVREYFPLDGHERPQDVQGVVHPALRP